MIGVVEREQLAYPSQCAQAAGEIGNIIGWSEEDFLMRTIVNRYEDASFIEGDLCLEHVGLDSAHR